MTILVLSNFIWRGQMNKSNKNSGDDALRYELENCLLDTVYNPLDITTYGPVPSLVGNPVINFTASAVMADNQIDDRFNLVEYLEGSYGLIFFYPADFSFVCPTEIVAHDNKMKDFQERNVKVLGISVDSKYVHLAWKNTPVEKGGVGNLQFPLIADINRNISRSYRVLTQEGVALRASFLVDKDGIIRHISINDTAIGRSVDETLRVIDALQFTEKHGEMCPANWKKGDEGITASLDGVAEYMTKNSEKL